MYNRLTQKALLKLAFIALMTPYLALAGSGSKINQATDETSDQVPHAVAAPLATPTDQLSFEMIPPEIIKLILEGLAKSDLQNMRLVEKKLRDLVTPLFTDIKIPRNLPNVKQFKKFFWDLATDKFWENKKPSEAFTNLFRHAPVKELSLIGLNISPEGIKILETILPISLENLDLSHTNMGDEEAKALAQGLPSKLKWLNLSYNNIGNEGAKALAQSLPSEIIWLSLNGNKIEDKVVLTALLGAIPSTDLKKLTISVPETSPIREQFSHLRNRHSKLVEVSFQ
ncbi:MAG: hypothetical protein ACRC4G_03430 [Alphaproteobacteria bacterium]